MVQVPSSRVRFAPRILVAGMLVAGLALGSCGQGDKAVAPGQTVASSMEPIDAVPLPLDEPVVTPPPTSTPVKAVEDAKAEPSEAATSDAPVEVETTGAAPPRIAIAAPDPTAAPAKPSAPRTTSPPPPSTTAEPERPVLNF